MKLQLDQSLDEAAEKAAVRGQQLHDSAIRAARLNAKLKKLCADWMREHCPVTYQSLRDEVGFKKPYIPRPDMKGKVHAKTKQRSDNH